MGPTGVRCYIVHDCLLSLLVLATASINIIAQLKLIFMNKVLPELTCTN